LARKLLKAKFRSRALALLARGYTIAETTTFLRKRYHPDEALEVVRNAYFPIHSPFAISRLEGKSRKEILTALRRIGDARKRASELFKRLNEDPDFARARAERTRKVLRRRNADSDFVRDKTERLKRLNADLEFRAKHLYGVKRFWEDYRLRKAVELHRPAGWGGPSSKQKGRERVPIVVDLDEIVAHDLLREDVVKALTGLPSLEQAVVSEEYGLDFPHGQDLKKIDGSEWNRLLNLGLAKLRKNKKLKNWLG